MTLSQFVTAVRNRHRAVGDTNWGDEEILDLLTHRINETLAITGLIEGTDTSITTVAGTQSYTIPTDIIRPAIILYDGEMLQQLSFRDWENKKAAGTTPSGKTIQYVIWGGQLILIPIPSEAVAITIYAEKEHSYMTATTDTLEIPTATHGFYINPVLADMYAKDLNQGFSQMYEQKFQQYDIPKLLMYMQRARRGGRVKTLLDADTHPVTDSGSY